MKLVFSEHVRYLFGTTVIVLDKVLEPVLLRNYIIYMETDKLWHVNFTHC